MKPMKIYRNKTRAAALRREQVGTLMHDADYLQTLAERHRRFARTFQHVAIRERLQSLADDLEDRVRELQEANFGLPAGEYEALN